MKKIIKKIKKLKKPSKKYIRQEIIKEIRSDAKELLDKYFKKLDDGLAFAHGKYKTEIHDYKGVDWSVNVTIPHKDDSFGRYHLFINKETGKNCYPRKVDDES